MRPFARWRRAKGFLSGALFLTLPLALPCRAGEPADGEIEIHSWTELAKLRDMLKPLCEPMGETMRGDWLARFPEKGQSFALYAAENKGSLPLPLRKIYILPVGAMSKGHSEALSLAARHLEIYYGFKTTVFKELPLAKLPKDAERMNPFGTGRQLNAEWIIGALLKPRFPKDAAILAGVTAEDIWPGEDGWNYVFGLAMGRICILSTKRYGEPLKADGTLEPQFLRRLFELSVHECGHDIGIAHCTAYSCVMCGSNSLEESDRRSLELCAECLPKLLMATGCRPAKRSAALVEFYKGCGLKEEARREEGVLKALEKWGIAGRTEVSP